VIQQPRYYERDGIRYPSVTTVLGIIRRPHLEEWRGRLGNAEADRVAQEAADLGSAVHQTIARINRGERVRPRPEIRPIVDAYRRWRDQAVAEVLAVEETVYHTLYRYAGTLDLLVRIWGRSLPAVVDIKTSSGIYPEMGLQLAAYRAALEAEQGIRTGGGLIVRLPKDGSDRVEVRAFADYPRDLDAFRWALGLWRYLHEEA